MVGTSHDIESIAPTRKNNGLLLRTSEFIIFVWKKSKLCQFVMQCVENGESDCGYPLVVVLTKQDPFFKLGQDTSRTAFFSEEKDDFTEQISYQLVLLPQETSLESAPPTQGKKK